MMGSSGRIIYFPLSRTWYPGIDAIFHLRELQDKFDSCHADLALIGLEQNLSRFQMVVRRQQMVNTQRESWKVLDGGKKESNAALTAKYLTPNK